MNVGNENFKNINGFYRLIPYEHLHIYHLKFSPFIKRDKIIEIKFQCDMMRL